MGRPRGKDIRDRVESNTDGWNGSLLPIINLKHGMAIIIPNAQYNVASADSLAVRVSAHQRRKMFDRFLADTGVTARESVLDVGVTSDRSYQASNYLEHWYPHKKMIT